MVGQDGAQGGRYGKLFFQGNNHFSNNLSKVYIINLPFHAKIQSFNKRPKLLHVVILHDEPATKIKHLEVCKNSRKMFHI
jgi:hypothetical protein